MVHSHPPLSYTVSGCGWRRGSPFAYPSLRGEESEIAEPAVETRDLAYRYGGQERPALNGVDFKVADESSLHVPYVVELFAETATCNISYGERARG